jgi:hypothetical protein
MGDVLSIPTAFVDSGGTVYENWTPNLEGATTVPSFVTSTGSGAVGGYLIHPERLVGENGEG